MIYGQEHSKCQYTEAGGNILFSPRNLSSQKVAFSLGGADVGKPRWLCYWKWDGGAEKLLELHLD